MIIPVIAIVIITISIIIAIHIMANLNPVMSFSNEPLQTLPTALQDNCQKAHASADLGFVSADSITKAGAVIEFARKAAIERGLQGNIFSDYFSGS